MAGDRLNDADWALDPSWSSSFKPTAGDDAILPKENTHKIIDSTGAADGIKLGTLMSHPEFIGRFASQSTPIATAAALVDIRGRGNFFLEVSANGASVVTDEVRVRCANRDALVEIDGQSGDAGLLDSVELERGNVKLKGDLVWDTNAFVRVGMIEHPDDVTLDIASAAPALPDLAMIAGNVTLGNVVTRLNIHGGECWKENNKAVTIAIRNGMLHYNHAAVATDVTRIDVYAGGSLDLLENSVYKVLDFVIMWPGSHIAKDDLLHTITKFVDLRPEKNR